jgi:hypothetical protein
MSKAKLDFDSMTAAKSNPRVIAIGDIHGCSAALRVLLKNAAA